MVKYLIVLFHSLALLIYGLLGNDNGISITPDIPERMTAGVEVKAGITLSKGEMSGFARLQIELPEGIIIKDAEEKGASYEFNNGIAKWVWAELPAGEEVTIRFSLLATSAAVGRQQINASYSYIEDNDKKVVEMPTVGVEVLPEEAFPAVTTHNVSETPVAANRDSIASPEDPLGAVSVTRTIGPGKSINEFEIGILIYKGNTSGFARYSDDLPPGVNVKSVKTDGASFSVADGRLRFVWVNVPAKSELEISYVLTSSVKEDIVLRGEYSYLEDNQSRKFLLTQETLGFQGDVVATEPVAPASPTPAPEKKDSVRIAVAKKKTAEKIVAPAQKNEAGIVYQVQIGAFSKRKVTAAKLKTRFKLNENVRSEMHGGYTKFMVGEHAVYKGARDHRERIITENGIKSAFVVAYHFGKRITVQEALMISKQKWFK